MFRTNVAYRVMWQLVDENDAVIGEPISMSYCPNYTRGQNQ